MALLTELAFGERERLSTIGLDGSSLALVAWRRIMLVL
jgi:hypothetical protein